MKEVHIILSNNRIVSVHNSKDLAISMLELLDQYEYPNLKVKTYQVI